MTQNPGYDPQRDPAEGSRPDPRARNGYPAQGDDARYARGEDPRYAQQNGYDPRAYGQDQRNGAPYGGGYGAPAPARDNAPREDQYDPQSYGQGYQDQAYDQQAYGQQAYQDQGGQPYSDQAYGQQGYQDPAYQDQAYQEPGYDQQAYSEPAAYQQPAYDYPPQQNGYPQAGYPAGYQQPAYGYDEPAYGDSQGLSATLQLEDGSGRYFQLRDGQNIIGRGQDAQFRLPDTGVSRRHVEIRWDGRVAMLSDLGSTNGTTVNGSPVQDWQLADGDVIRAGHSEILVRIV